MCASYLTPWLDSTTCQTPTREPWRWGRGSVTVPVDPRSKSTSIHQPTLPSGQQSSALLCAFRGLVLNFSMFSSLSAASFSSLATGFRRTSSLDQRPDQTHTTNGPAETEVETMTECPIHPPGVTECPVHPSSGVQGSGECPVHQDDTTADCLLHSTNNSSDCPIHTSGEAADCPMHSPGGQSVPAQPDCHMREEGRQHRASIDCPLHTSGVQISISAPEPEPQEEDTVETRNHREVGGDTGSMTASRESLARYHACDGGIGISSNNTLSHVPRTSIFKRPGRKRRHGDETFDHEISAFFPANLDFMALQEVFDHGATSKLRRQLHRYFPYVLSDVGRYGWKGCCSRFKFLNSGLLLASRYPILDARFECYPNGRGEDALAAKGALFAKVRAHTLLFDFIIKYIF